MSPNCDRPPISGFRRFPQLNSNLRTWHEVSCCAHNVTAKYKDTTRTQLYQYNKLSCSIPWIDVSAWNGAVIRNLKQYAEDCYKMSVQELGVPPLLALVDVFYISGPTQNMTAVCTSVQKWRQFVQLGTKSHFTWGVGLSYIVLLLLPL